MREDSLRERRTVTMPLGVVIRRAPGTTRWAREIWSLADVIPFAPPADWTLLREEGAVAEWHAATLPLELHRADAEAYRQGLSARVPSVWVISRREGTERPVPTFATASPFEAQDYGDNGDDIVEKAPMPEGLIAWVRDFTLAHHEEEAFRKRQRRGLDERTQDGIGDARVAQGADVFRSPASLRARRSA